MVQEEVADRLIAEPGTPDYGSLSVFVQFYCDAKIVARAKRTVFLPSPEVDSAIVRLDVLPSPAVEIDDEQLFFKIVRASFGQRRKTLLRSLSGSPDLGWSKEKAHIALEKAGIDSSRRGETLSLEEFASITKAASD
jgi:16S rRNA (adenine1518-N6/adenine1519-N6)-dimethyltransferase